MSHLEERMEADLNEIRERFWELGEDVEQALRNAKKTLLVRDEELAYRTILGDYPINRNSRACDHLCHAFSARYLPGAGILREMTSTIRANIALERIGDYAVTVCREAIQLGEPLSERFARRVDELADESISILSESRKAFREGNADIAVAQMKRAKRIEGRMDAIYEELFAADDRLDGKTMMAIFTVFNAFKRVADQSKNICDQTVYAARGIAKIPKVYRILFLDDPGSDLAPFAVAIGRKFSSGAAEFFAANPEGTRPISSDLRHFLDEHGLPEEDLDSEPLAAVRHDLGDFDVIVSLRGPVSGYLEQIPFHTSVLNWPAPEGQTLQEAYRELREKVGALVTLLAGDEGERA